MMKKAALGILAAAALAGCVTSSGPKYNIINPYDFFQRYARGGQFPVMVAGQPYAGRQPAVEAAVIDGFERTFTQYGKALRITPVANEPYGRWVVVFNLPGRPGGNEICANSVGLARGAGGVAGEIVHASAAFCAGNEHFSSAWVSFPNPGSPDSLEFRDAMMRLVMESVPRDDDPSHRCCNEPRIP